MSEEISVPGYKHLVTMEDRCGGRVTVRGHRLEPHQVKRLYLHGEPLSMLSFEAVQECLIYCERRDVCTKCWRVISEVKDEQSDTDN